MFLFLAGNVSVLHSICGDKSVIKHVSRFLSVRHLAVAGVVGFFVCSLGGAVAQAKS